MIVGFTCGAFDLFHAGHIAMLAEISAQCDFLIVGVQTDPSIDRPEKNKPIQTLIERQLQVQACRYVDQVIVYETEADLLTLLNLLPIDKRFLDITYRDKDFTGKSIKRFETVYNSRDHYFSSTDLRGRIKNNT